MRWTTHFLFMLAFFVMAAPAWSATPDILADLQSRALAGDTNAQNQLGMIYASGQGVAPSRAEAIKWFRMAAHEGYSAAQTNLAIAYIEGHDGSQHYSKAFKWFSQAAQKGNPVAEYNLGLLFEDGHGAPQDAGQAVQWYRKAANQGYVDAQNALGCLYMTGAGVPRDFARAFFWHSLASRRDPRLVGLGFRRLAAEYLTSGQISAINRRVGLWRPSRNMHGT